MPITLPARVLPPALLNQLSFAAQAGRIEQIVSPFLQWTAQPTVDWNTEAHLRPVDQRPRHVAIQDTPQDASSKNPSARHDPPDFPGVRHHV